MTPKRTLIAGLLLASALALTACGVPAPVPTAETTGSGSPTPTAAAPTRTPTPTPLPTAQSDVLFTISAKITSPVGAVARVEQVVHQPVTQLDDRNTVESQLDEECSGWRTSIGEGEFIVSTITAKDLSAGGKKWPISGQVVVTMSGTPVFMGDFDTFQSLCASVQVKIPSQIRGVSPIVAGSDPDDPGGWATLTYGFGIPTEAGTDATDRRYPQITECRITLSPFAEAASAIARSWLTDAQAATGLCEVNTPGV